MYIGIVLYVRVPEIWNAVFPSIALAVGSSVAGVR